MQRRLTAIALGITAAWGALAAPAPATSPATDSAAILLHQARLWQQRNRHDLARETLNKLLRSAPDHADAIAELAFVEWQSGQKDLARQHLERLRVLQPGHLGIARIDTLSRLEGKDKERLQQARALAYAGKPEQALVILNSLYPAGPPTGDLALEYWQIVTGTENGWERALAGFKSLVARYPDNRQYRLVLAEHITKRRPADKEALKTIIELTRDPRLERPARVAWRNAMLRLGASPASIPLIEQYLSQEKVEDTTVKEHLARIKAALERQRILLADPHYRLGREGLILLEDNSKLDAAADKLEQSLAGRPDDPQVLGGLGLVRMRQGRHAEAQQYFRQALQRDPGNSRWSSLLTTSRYWGLMREAGDALDASDYPRAEALYGEARTLDPREPAALVGLGRTYAAQGRQGDAEKILAQALLLDPSHEGALETLATLYLRNGREQDAENLVAVFAGKQPGLAATVARVRATLLREKADRLLAQGKQDEAIALLEQAAQYDQEDPWLRFQLARLYAGRGAPEKGDALFSALLAAHPDDPSARYAYALFQSGLDRDHEALATLERIAREQRSENMTGLQRRLWVRVLVQHVLALAAQGDTDAARRLLDSGVAAVGDDAERLIELANAWLDIGGEEQAAAVLARIERMSLEEGQKASLDDARITLAISRADALRLQGDTRQALEQVSALRRAYADNAAQRARLLRAEARFARANKRLDLAEENYRALLASQPDDRDAAIALIEVLVERGNHDAARPLLDAQLASIAAATPDQSADLIGVLMDMDEHERARQLLAATPETPRSLLYTSQLAERDGRIDDAVDALQRSLAGDPEQYQGRYRTLAEWLDRQASWFSGAISERTRSGTSGISRYRETEIPLEYRHGETEAGRWALRMDLVRLDAGRLSANSGEPGRLLQAAGRLARPHYAQQANGIALNVGLERGNTRYDIGTTPLGFPVQSIVGGILHKGDLGPFGYSLDISRRPVTGSLLSYAGMRAPGGGETWGGVRATGVRLGLSLDDGGTFGGWSSFGVHRLTGKNVLGNTRVQLMAGGQMRVINEEDRLLQFGVTGMLWYFSQNAGEYTFGHGGYYSPHTYRSVSFPVTYGERYARWSWAVRGSVSFSRSTTEDALYFPTSRAMQSWLTDVRGENGVYTGGSSTGKGRSLSLAWEYQMDKHTFVGGVMELDRSPDYSPNRFLFYMRHALDKVAARPVSFLPQPFGPTSQY